ncbi:MAG: glycosyltransferase family 9 protein [Elusimicrobia bacterium]|nr:glycosyltransferase family 9 protein [Elusimicrobiota bacterium]
MRALFHARACLGAAWIGLKRRLTGVSPRPVKRVLVLGYAAIGDLLFFLPVLEVLRREHPEAEIVFLSNPYPTTRELIPETNLVDEVWLHDWEGPQGREGRGEINRRIADGGFDLAVLTLSAPAHYFQQGLEAVPEIVGHIRPWGRLKRALITGDISRRALITRVARVAGDFEHVLARNLRLLEALGMTAGSAFPRPRLPISDKHRRKVLDLMGVPLPRRRVGVHLGDPGNPYGKMWPPERFAEVCRRLSQKASLEFVLIGGPEEKNSARRALESFPGMLSMVGRLSLLESFAAIETCSLFLSNDTGLAKASMLLGVPTVTWWGPSNPAEYGAVWDTEKHLDLRTGIACSPCTAQGMPARPYNYLNCGHRDCLGKLEVGFALEAVLKKYPDILGAG